MQQAIAVTFVSPMLSDHSFQGGTVTANSRIEVTKNYVFFRAGNSDDDGVQVFIKRVLDLFWVSHGGSTGADNGEILLLIGEGKFV